MGLGRREILLGTMLALLPIPNTNYPKPAVYSEPTPRAACSASAQEMETATRQHIKQYPRTGHTPEDDEEEVKIKREFAERYCLVVNGLE